jgi:hypothetical protein
MLSPTPSLVSIAFGPGARPHPTARQLTVTVRIEAAALWTTRPVSRPQRLAATLDGLLTDGARLATPASAHAAARAFDSGNGFLPAQLIDRAI